MSVIALVGLATMGMNLARNLARNGFGVSVYNRTTSRVDDFMKRYGTEGDFTAAHSPEELVRQLDKPRRILMMVKAGPPVDETIDHLAPYLEAGDILIDGGNSYFLDTVRRGKALEARGLRFIGTGVSGGEEGALLGPSIMPGGDRDAYQQVEPMLTKISAHVDGEPCCTYIGPGGAGHYVKMVHNGIEYGDMQLIAETYNIMRHALDLSAPQMSEIFARWNEGRLNSYLIEITAKVLAFVDGDTGRPLVDLILDEAEQKGTGRWTSQNAIEMGIPIPTIDAAVWSRNISALKELRVEASKVLMGPSKGSDVDRDRLLAALEGALYAAKVSSYAQGMALLRAASETYGWELNLAEIARIWKGGCIIRAELLDTIQQAFKRDPRLNNLLLDPGFAETINWLNDDWRYAVQVARQLGVPCPAMSASLDYFDSYRAERLPANLIQGQRDFFGAHTYRRIDKPGTFHTEWEAQGEAGSVPAPHRGAVGEDEHAERAHQWGV